MELPAYLQDRVDQLVAEAPPLTPEQQRVLQALFAPVVARIAAREASRPPAAVQAA